MFLRYYSLNRSTASREIYRVMPVLSKDARIPAGKYKKRAWGEDGSRATEEASVARTPVSELLYISTYTVLGGLKITRVDSNHFRRASVNRATSICNGESEESPIILWFQSWFNKSMSNPQEDLDESPEGPLHFSSQPHEVQGPVSVSSRPGKAFGLDAQRVAAEEEWLALADCVLMHVSTRKLKAQAKRRRQSKVTETRSVWLQRN
ncbi:hypothetical protein OPV22_033547 [Ensete ventricosum]|uniref:Uncharacterized protein n=1 Tax=Ensete ventricosum TaxID=4639 RepID=A0AAV8PQ17_ENSVE|nr:hypothetical protein OPV22_033547 [Ensete ventricosum]